MDSLEAFKGLWSELGNLLNEAERDEENGFGFREDVSTLRHFWSQLGSVIQHVESKNHSASVDEHEGD